MYMIYVEMVLPVGLGLGVFVRTPVGYYLSAHGTSLIPMFRDLLMSERSKNISMDKASLSNSVLSSSRAPRFFYFIF